MVKCSKCGAEHQPQSVYCDNCGIPVYETKGTERLGLRKMSVRMMTGLLVGAALFGVGIVLGLLGNQLSQSNLMWSGIVFIIIGIIALLYSILILSES